MWTTGRDAARLLALWAILNVACAYLPVAFQRRVIQGADFPIALLGGIGAAWLLVQFGRKFSATCYGLAALALLYLSFAWEWGVGAQVVAIGGFWYAYITEKRAQVPNALFAALALTFACGLTNLYFLRNDVLRFRSGTMYYLPAGQIAALQWARDNTPQEAIVQPIAHLHVEQDDPDPFKFDDNLARFAPEISGRQVYQGHYAETIRNDEKNSKSLSRAAGSAATPDGERCGKP